MFTLAFAACEGLITTKKHYTVTFNANGGSPAPAQQTIAEGGTVTVPLSMTKSGNTFGGWYKEAARTNPWDFGTDTVSGNITLYAQWLATISTYTLTFNTSGGSTVARQTVNAGSQVSKPDNPTKAGYTFDNWYTAETGGSVVSWPLTVNGKTTIYARWNAVDEPVIQYTVTFNTLGGSAVPSQTVNAGSQVSKPGNPAKTNYTFDNWYTAESGGSVVSWSLTITGNTTIYARWIAIQYTLTFNTTDGSAVANQTVNAGSQVSKPDSPTKAGYTFDNWYTAETGGAVVTWPLTVNGNTTVYAHWNGVGIPVVQYDVIFNTLGGSAVPSQTVNAGSQVTKPGNPTKANYTFDNWYTAETGGAVVSWPFTVNGDTTVYAHWNGVGIPVVQYDVIFNTLGGSTIPKQAVNAGSQVTEPGNPTKTNYTFDNWYTAESGGSVVSWPLTVNSNTTVYARWITNEINIGDQPGIALNIPGGAQSGTFTITATAGFDSYQWMLDGRRQSTTGNTLTVNPAPLAAGRHSISVTGVKDTVPYSAAGTFTVMR